MKKLLILFVVVCMLLSAIPLVASADNNVAKPESNQIPEAPTAVEDENTIYVSSTGNDGNAGTKDEPRKSLNKAYNKALLNAKNNKSNTVTICVLDDVNLCESGVVKFSSAASNLPTQDCTVYIFGVKKADGTYPTVKGTGAANWMTLGTDTVIYDLNFENGSGRFIICTAFHKLTIGNNFDGGDRCTITGGMWSNLLEDVKNSEGKVTTPHMAYNIIKAEDGTSKNGAAINIYDGIFEEVDVTWPQDCQQKTNACVVSQPSELNIYNATITTLNDVGINGKNSSAIKVSGAVTINIFNGTVSTLNAVHKDKKTEVYASKTASVTLGEKTTGLNRSVGLIANGEAQYCGVQDGIINEKGAVRFVGIVDSLEYEEVGFEITAAVEQNFDFTTSCRYVYNSLLGMIDGEAKIYTAEELGGKYIYAVAIQDIPPDGTVTFKIRAFVTQGGTKYYGKEYTETYTNGKYVEEAKTFSVASLNLRNNNNDVTAENFVDARMPRIINFINTEKPDSIGVQECDLNLVAENMRDRLNSGIIDSGYKCAQEEQTSSSGDFAFKNFIWYNSDTTDCTASGQYWLSETPETASKSFGTNFYISMGWAKLKNKTTGYEYVHVNTHLAVNGEDVRLKEIEVLLNKVNELTENGKLPVFLTGDMNSQPGSAEYKKLTEAFRDTRFMTTNTTNSNTYTCFGTDKDPRIIDFCLCSVDENVAGINRFQVVDQYNGGWLSDHNALLVDVWATASK